MSKLRIIYLLLIISVPAFAQDEDEFGYTTEYSYGLNFNTNGGLIGGFALKHARAINDRMYHNFALEIVNVKHPKEVRYSSPTGESFIYGKQNYLYAIRMQYGREFILFRKAPEEGVQINAIFAGGPTLGILAPYYIKYADSRNNIHSVPYDPNAGYSQSAIMGTGYLFQGLGDSKIRPGLNVKAALGFEFGAFKNNVAGFETGILLEAYPQKIILVPNASNRSFFSSAYITVYWGTRR